MTKRWLIFSYFANIDAMAPSHHIDDRLPLFAAGGVDVCLLSSPCGERNRAADHHRIPSLAPSGIRFEIKHFLRRTVRTRFWYRVFDALLLAPVLPFYGIEKAIQKITLKLDSTWSWFFLASVAGLYEVVRKRPSVVYSTGGSISAHLAAVIVTALTKVPWVAEFQDPLVYQYPAITKTEGRFIQWVERVICRRATRIVFLTETARLHTARRAGCFHNTATVYPGAAPNHFPAPEDVPQDICTFAHIGSLGGTRNLDYLLEGLGPVLDESRDLATVVRLRLYGNAGKKERRSVREFSHGSVVELLGKVRREEAIDAMRRSSVLLLIQNADGVSSETIPSKVYEYLLTGRPILALVYRNPELQGMLEEMGHIVVQADDAEAIRKGLETYITEWKQGRLRSVTATSPYTVEKAVEKLISLVEDGEEAERR